MSSTKQIWIALIRAIGGATHGKMSMAHLREGCSAAGLADVKTVLATGNVIFASDKTEAEISAILDRVIAAHGLKNEVFLRRPDALRTSLAANPFPEAAAERPSRMLISFMKRGATANEITAACAYAGPERIALIGRDAFIDYADDIGTSKLTPVRLEKLLGQSGTARNWNTVLKLVQAAT